MVQARRTTAGGPTRPSPIVRTVVKPMTGVLNPALRRLAGHQRPAGIAQTRHCGRRSGRPYVTPVSARLTGGTFLVALTFGDQSDWCQNVLAAGGCSIRWKARDYRASHPRVVDPASVDKSSLRSAFNPIERAMLRALGIKKFLLLDRADTNTAPTCDAPPHGNSPRSS